MPDNEVQYERLRPAQIIARREQCPVAYLPIGTLEWHGIHNPVGLDALKSHALCVRFARRTGGLAFPPLWYGENRSQALVDATAVDREQVAAEMGLPPGNFAPGYMVESVADQNLLCHSLLVHICHQIKSLGFKVLVICAGHYPLLDHARSAAAFFHQEQTRPRMITWAMAGFELLQGQMDPCGDHAGKWETSLLMHLDGGMQDLSLLPADRSAKLVGATSNNVQDSTSEFGQQAADAIAQAVELRVRDFLANNIQYQRHGCPT